MAIEILISVRSCLSRCLSFFLSVMQTLCLLPQCIYICQCVVEISKYMQSDLKKKEW